MNIHSIPPQAKKLKEYYERATDIPNLSLQQLEISHPDDFVPVRRMVSVHELNVNVNHDEEAFSTVSSIHSQISSHKRPSKPLPKAPTSQQDRQKPPITMSPLMLPQQLSPIMQQSKPVYNSIFGYEQDINTETYSSLLNQTFDERPNSFLEQPASHTYSRPASVHSRHSTYSSAESPDSQNLLSPSKLDYFDCSDDDGASLYSYHSLVSNHRSIVSKRSMERISGIPNAEHPPERNASPCIVEEEEEEDDNASYVLPHLGTMGGGWRLSIQNPSPGMEDVATPPELSPVTPQDYDTQPRKRESKELADKLFIERTTEEPIRAVSPFWQQISPPISRSPSQMERLLQPTTFLDPTRAYSPVSSLGTSSFTGSYRQFSGSDFSYDTRSSSPGLNIQDPIANSVNEMAAGQEVRNSWAGPSPEWIQSMNSARQRSSVPPPPVPQPVDEPIIEKAKSRYSIASHSLTNDPDTVKTMRRMANLTKDPNTQIVYAMYLLEVCQMHEIASGHNTPKSATRERLLKEAVYWIERLSKERHPEASYIKGLWYHQGLHGFKKNEDKAHRTYQTAAKVGHVKAKFKLGQYHEKKGQLAKAVAFYKSSTVKGGVEPNFKMAQILLYGELKQKRNLKLGLEYLRRAADLANASTNEPALMMGQMFTGEFKKVNIPKDLIHPDNKLGVKYILKAAELGNADALDRMARAYQFGELEQEVDLTRSFRYYEKAAERGHVQSMLSLSKMYLDGQAVEINESLAFKWCERSAASGFDHAEFALGYYYEMGVGVQADYPRALEYYGKAATKGHEAAAAALNRNDSDSQGNGNGITKVVHHGNRNKHVVDRHSKNSKDCAIM